MALFSQRKGFTPLEKAIQTDSVDTDLRNGMWSLLTTCLWDRWAQYAYGTTPDTEMVEALFNIIWLYHFKLPIDQKPAFRGGYGETGYDILRKHFFACKWYEFYDFVEFIAKRIPTEESEKLRKCVNGLLEQERSAYRFVSTELVQITDEIEIQTIDTAIAKSPEGARIHLSTALQYLSDRKNPDYRNSIKEAISGVESICRRMCGGEHVSLGDAIKKLKTQIDIHPALEKSFSALYGYTSNAEGIRHAMLDQTTVTFADAKFMLAACAAFINYLLGKCSEQGIKIEKCEQGNASH